MITSETALVDTNILVYAADRSAKHHTESLELLNNGFKGEISLCVCPQVLCEYFAVVTDPKRVNKPINSKEAIFEIQKYYSSNNVEKIYDPLDIVDRLLDLLDRYTISKQEIFDLKLLATMLANQVTNIFTYNQSHFERFKEIKVLEP